MQKDHVELLMQGRWFAGLPLELKELILGGAVVKPYPRGTRLFSRGDANVGLFCVLQGGVEIGAVDLNGRDCLLAVLQPSQWFGEIALFDDGPRTHDAQARGATTLLLVPIAELKQMIKEEPILWRHLGRLIAEKIRAVFQGTEGGGTISASVRVARRLLAMSHGHGMLLPGCVRTSLAVNQHQLGSMLGLTRQTVSEVLCTLEAEGIVRKKYGAIDVLNIESLRRIATSV